MTDQIFEITKAAAFDAAHFLPMGADDSPYRRMHGHSFTVEATLRGTADQRAGWVADLGDLDAALKGVAADLDHGVLNDKPGLENPTLEHLCLHFAAQLKARFPQLAKIAVARPTVGERCELTL